MPEHAPSPQSSERNGLPSGLPWLVLGLALLLRLVWLGVKPPHFDEGVNGWFVDQMTRRGYYHYDPGNYHGPFHFYVLWLMQTLFGRSIEALRLPLVLINTATIGLVFQFQRWIPRRACLLAALAMAVSPGMLFYSRYAIHEAWFVFGMVLAFWGVAELWTRGSERGLWAVALGVTLLMLTKETFIMHLVAFGLALGTLRVLERFIPSAPLTKTAVRQQWNGRSLATVLAANFGLIVFFYSGGFLDPHRDYLLRFGQAFVAWTHTGVSGSGHEKPFWYWLELFGRYEWPAALGLLYALRALAPGMNRLLRLLAIYGCGTLVAYSIVPYKTPWCIISLLWPFLFLFGSALDEIPKTFARLAIATGLLLVSTGQAIDLNYRRPTDPTHRYVYVQTLNDFFKLTRPLGQLVKQNPEAYHRPGHILLSSYHPLPWALGDFTAVGYYEKATHWPDRMDAAFIVAEESRIAEVEKQLQERYFVESFQLRDSMSGGRLYLNARDFAPVFPGRVPEFEPQTKPAP
jgi:uncharacterized protein (TIGR03663 family)